MIPRSHHQPNTPRSTFLPYALPTIGQAEIDEVVDSLRSGWVTTGPKVQRFQQDFAAYVNARHAIAVNSCTAGLHVALAALGIGPGDEVIVPTLTFCATANVAAHLGARPVLVDVDNDLNISVASAAQAITPRTKAIMPVHFGGQACNLNEIYALAAQHNLAVVEDGAHVVGATYRGHKIGSDALSAEWPNLTRVTTFSFYATKNMTTGEGGMVTTNADELAEQMRLLTLHGMSRDAWKRYTSAGSWYYEIVASGYKYNMTDINAAMGIHQLRQLDDFIAIRQRYAEMYDECFDHLPEVAIPVRRDDRSHIYHIYVLRLNLDRLTIDRATFIEELKDANIGTSVHFIPVHLHPYYQEQFGYQSGDLPRAEALYEGIISLPLYPRMTESDVYDVTQSVQHIIVRNRRNHHA